MQDLQQFTAEMRAYFESLPADLQNTVLYSRQPFADLQALQAYAQADLQLYEG